MNDDVQVKICGLTTAADAVLALGLGADFFGFVLHPKSPRFVSLGQYASIAGLLPAGRRVAVIVEPAAGDLVRAREAGFDRFQVHFRHDLPLAALEAWSREAGAADLWLAPKLPPEVDVPATWMGLAHTFLVDTFDPNLFGGTGRTGDWPKFRRHREAHPEKTWILSGGLNPANVGDALAGSGSRFVDVNSGVESAPGVKDRAKLAAFLAAVRGRAPA